MTAECTCVDVCHKAAGSTLSVGWHCRVEREHADRASPIKAEVTTLPELAERLLDKHGLAPVTTGEAELLRALASFCASDSPAERLLRRCRAMIESLASERDAMQRRAEAAEQDWQAEKKRADGLWQECENYRAGGA